MKTEITQAQVSKLLEVVDAGLVAGVGVPEPGKMCVEAAVCYALGLPHGDDPKCVSPVVRDFKIVLNDANWSSLQARAKGMRRLAVIQLGTAGVLDEQKFCRLLALLAVKKYYPTIKPVVIRWLKTGDESLRDAAVEAAEGAQSAQSARSAAWSAADAAWSAAWSAQSAAWSAQSAAEAAWSAAQSARSAAQSAQSAAWSAAYAARSAESIQGGDQELSKFAEGVVQILVGMEVPGARWLELTE